MGTPHINAEIGDFAKVVLMPGDPKRAKWIAETFLHDYKEVTNLRGMLGFTGYTQNGKRISVMASGMGQPSIGIYSHELYTHFGVETIIRVGTCGSYQPEVNLFDVLVCTSASTDSSWGSQYGVKGTYCPCADLDLAIAAKEVCQKKGFPFHAGNVLSADVFYDWEQDSWKAWAKLGVLGVEMESFALYCNASINKKKALCMLTVTDSFINKERKATPEERMTGLSNMVGAAIEVAEKFAD